MSAIQSSVGLITGIPIEDTVDQLMSLASRPRTTLINRTAELSAEQSAVNQLSSLVLGLKFSLNTLNRDTTFGARTATSSDPTAITASVPTGATPTAGSYQLTPLRAASSHQLVSSSIDELANALGGGDLELGFGGRVNKGVSLDQINGGEGFQAGKIKITDRSGDSATIDLRAATTIDEVLNAINESDEIDVTASVDGDGLVLTDNTGDTGVFRVREVGSGTTAASLGIAGLTESADTLSGADIFGLAAGTKLSTLNDGLGVSVNELEDIGDLLITLSDGTEASVDLSTATTIGDVLEAINEHADLAGKVTAAIGGDQNRLTITDDSGGAGTLIVEGSAAGDLGLDSISDAGVVTGSRVVSGLKGTLLSSLNGGTGFEAGSIEITDRAGVSATVDLSSAETLNDVLQAINDAAPEVTASINSNGTGISLSDASGGAGSLTIAEASGGTAESLGLLVDVEADTFDTGTLNRSTVGKQTKLSDLRGGEGIARGRFTLTDSSGRSSTVDLRFTGVENPTLGDVIEKINSYATKVTASLNETGDGLLLTDTAGGSGELSVTETNGGSTASQLRILGASSTTNEDGQQTIDGTGRFSIDLSEIEVSAAQTPLTAVNSGSGVDLGFVTISDSADESKTIDLRKAATLQDVIDKINDSGLGVSAALNENGSGLELTDTAGGNETLTVEDLTGSAAEDLRIAGESTKSNDAGAQIINGSGLLSEGTPLESLATRINDFDGGFTAAVIFDGQGYRLSVSAERTGANNEIVVSGSGSSLSFSETSRPADAVALLGEGTSGGVTVTSKDGEFNEVIDGVNLTVTQSLGTPVQIDVARNDDPLSESIQGFVDSYNAIRSNLESVTDFDSEALTTGILFGRNEAVRVDTELSRLASGRFTTGSFYTSLESIGIALDQDGNLSLDQTKLGEALDEDRGAVERLFRDEDHGVVARFTQATDQLAGNENSLLSVRSNTLASTIDSNNARVEELGLSLDRQRESLLFEFYRLEETISLLQSNLSAIDAIQPVSIAS